MNKYIKILIIINGMVLPIAIGVILYQLYTKKSDDYYNYIPESIIVGEGLEKAKKDSIALQGLSYEDPQSIYNSTNFYMPVSVLTYEEAKTVKAMAESAGDISPYFYNYFNILFLDKDYEVIGALLDKKGFISEIQINHGRYYYRDDKVDTTVKHIAYSIGFDDSNSDGKLDGKDTYDLYISDHNGKNLVRVTENIDVLDYSFIESNTKIFIAFQERNDLREEHKKRYFGIYDIQNQQFRKLNSITESLEKMERQLLE